MAFIESPMSYHWEIIRSVLGGISILDLPTLAHSSYDQVDNFLAAYGYHFKQDDERNEVHAIHQESIRFLEEVLIPGTGLKIPDELKNPIDVRDIFLIAGKKIPSRQRTQIFACAILRLMHVITHINNIYRREDYEIIKETILSPIKRNIFEDKGHLFIGGPPNPIPIKSFEYREDKSKESMILKLLHKVDNTAQTIFDQIGVRFITPTRLDALFLIRKLRELNILTFSNIIGFRSRNNLIDIDRFIDAYRENEKLLAGRKITPKGFLENLYRVDLSFPEDRKSSDDNLFSDSNYRSLQFTLRTLVRYPHPGYQRKMEFLKLATRLGRGKKGLADGIKEDLRKIEVPRVVRFFFPYEIQIIDEASQFANTHGSGSHDVYKQKQLEFAKARIFRNLLKN